MIEGKDANLCGVCKRGCFSTHLHGRIRDLKNNSFRAQNKKKGRRKENRKKEAKQNKKEKEKEAKQNKKETRKEENDSGSPTIKPIPMHSNAFPNLKNKLADAPWT